MPDYENSQYKLDQDCKPQATLQVVPSNTKDQPKREAQVNKEQLKPQAHCMSLPLSHTKALLFLFYFYFFLHLLLHVSPGPSFHVGFESIALDPFFFILFFHQFSLARKSFTTYKTKTTYNRPQNSINVQLKMHI